MKKRLLVFAIVFLCLAISVVAIDEVCETNEECGLCEKCVDNLCVYQSASEDLKDECSAGDCASGLCDGAGACDIEPDTTECRASAGVCDIAENCDGLNDDCPADAFLPDTTECRASAGVCDIAEYCTGFSADCPLDAKSTAECRASAGVCDLAENCDSINVDCPTDAFLPITTECRASVGVCDIAEYCTGSSAPCPSDTYQSFGTDCGVCAACNGLGNCVYDQTQDMDCSPTLCPDSCFLSPDDNPYTWDYADDVPNECTALFECSSYDCSYSFECSMLNCGAQCEQDEHCAPNSCSETYFDYCTDKKLTEYNSDKVKDSTTITDECDNSCLGDCTCTDCDVSCPAPDTNTYCVQAVCGAQCDSNDDCADTECDVYDGCYVGTYRDYNDVANTCLDNCDCTQNECVSYAEIITDMDGDGYDIECDGDCDDYNKFTYPGAPEICDREDNNCDGIVPLDEIDNDGDGFAECEGDCNDYEASVYPGAPEIYCDGIDQNCNGMEDDNPDLDGDGVNYCEDKCLNTKPWYAQIIRELTRYDSSNLNPMSTYGCSCDQILYCKPGDNDNEYAFGCLQSTIDTWLAQYSWAPACQEDGKVVIGERVGETLWIVNHGVGQDDLVNLYGHGYDLTYVDGRVNTYLTTKRGFQTQGELYVLALDDYGARYWFSVDWSSVLYGAELVADNDDVSVVNANARVMWAGQYTYNVPIEITYHKTTREIDVRSQESFSFVGIEPTEWCVRQGGHTLCRQIT